MCEVTVFGICAETWQVINGLGSWVAAIGTVAAVVLSLHLARKADRPVVSISSSVVTRLETTSPGYERHYVAISVTNPGDRPVQVTQLGWQAGIFKKSYCIQLFDHEISSSLPVILTHGERADFYVPLDLPDEPWQERFPEVMLYPNWWINLATLRVSVISALGHKFTTKADSATKAMLKSQCKRTT